MNTKSNYFNFDELFNAEKNNSCLILGPSPNMLNFDFKKFDGKIICIGDSILRGKNIFSADYWIAANNEWPVPDYPPHLEIINSFENIKFIFSDSAIYDGIWTKSNIYLNKMLNVSWTTFDERHFNGQPCNPYSKCCNLIKKKDDNFTIQEKYYKYFKLNNFKLKNSSTVAEYALMIASMLGFKKIYLQGIEIPSLTSEYTYYPNKEVDEIIIKTKDFISKEIRNKNIKEGKFLRSKIVAYYNRIKNLDPLPSRFRQSKLLWLFVKIYSLFIKTSVFEKDLTDILYNFEKMSKILTVNNREIYNLSKTSNLNKCNSISYMDYSSISNKSNLI